VRAVCTIELNQHVASAREFEERCRLGCENSIEVGENLSLTSL
jgi:hypothetical protein